MTVTVSARFVGTRLLPAAAVSTRGSNAPPAGFEGEYVLQQRVGEGLDMGCRVLGGEWTEGRVGASRGGRVSCRRRLRANDEGPERGAWWGLTTTPT